MLCPFWQIVNELLELNFYIQIFALFCIAIYNFNQMYLKFFPPSPILEPHIYDIVVMHNRNSIVQLVSDKFVPGLGGGMAFHFVDPPILLTDNAICEPPRLFLFTPQHRFILMQPRQQIDCIFVKFKLSGIFNCLGVYPITLQNYYYVDLRAIFGKEVDDLYDRMCNEIDTEQRIKHLEAFLIQQLLTQKKVDKKGFLDFAVANIIENKGCCKLTDVCKLYDVDFRTFRRNFNTKMGINAKSFSRLVRINSIIKAIDNQNTIDINELIYKYNYFDQSHFINDFKDIVGETPFSYINRNKDDLKIISALK